jgi:hypothetical protein
VSGSRRLAWALLVLWSAWLFALQGLFAGSRAGDWAPDLGLILILALDARMPTARARVAALCVAAARIACSTDPPLAVVAGYLGAVACFGALRELVEIDRPLARAVLAGVLALALASWWILCRSLATPYYGAQVPVIDLAWRSALSTGLCALVLFPLLARLPGVSPLWRSSS